MTPNLIRFSILLATAFSLQSCMKTDADENRNYIRLNIKTNERYVYDLGAYGIDEIAYISKQARNYDSSYIKHDSAMSSYIYKPAADFIGTDEVELARTRGSQNASASATAIRYTTIRFTVSR